MSIVEENLKEILQKQEGLKEETIKILISQITKIVNKELKKKENKIVLLQDKITNLESDLDSKFKPNQTITLKIPQTRRPSDIGNLLNPELDEDNISIKTFRPDDDYSKDEIEDMILNRKIEKLDGIFERVTRENQEIQVQIQERLASVHKNQNFFDFIFSITENLFLFFP